MTYFYISTKPIPSQPLSPTFHHPPHIFPRNSEAITSKIPLHQLRANLAAPQIILYRYFSIGIAIRIKAWYNGGGKEKADESENSIGADAAPPSGVSALSALGARRTRMYLGHGIGAGVRAERCTGTEGPGLGQRTGPAEGRIRGRGTDSAAGRRSVHR